jgi:hypothetical protein
VPTTLSIQDLQRVVADDVRTKPPGLNADSRGLALRYMGDQRVLIEFALKERYPNARSMPVAPLAYVRLWARQDSGAYVDDATRYLIGSDGQAIDSGDARAEAFADALEAARVNEVLPEAERRALCGVRTVAAYVGFVPEVAGEPSAPVVHLYWPHDTVVITHPSMPSEERAIVLCALRQPSQDPKLTTWTVFMRDFAEDEDGVVTTWGPWQWCRIQEGDKGAVTPQEYAGEILPVAFLRTEQADGGFWPAAEKDVALASDQANVARSNLDHVTDMQGHSIAVISDDQFDLDEQPIGPDAAIRLRQAGSFSFATPSPAFAEMRENIEERQRAIATTRGNNPNAYSSSPGSPESGVARIIANIPHERRLRELRPAIKRFDERVCRIILDVLDAFDPAAPTFGPDVKARTELAQAKLYEDNEAKQRRLALDLDLGVISPADYAVAMGHYSSIDAAKEAGLPDIARLAAGAPMTAGIDLPQASEMPVVDAAPASGSSNADITVNELTLGLERLARIGDTDALNVLRAALAKLLGSAPLPDITASDLAGDAATVNEAIDNPSSVTTPNGNVDNEN